MCMVIEYTFHQIVEFLSEFRSFFRKKKRFKNYNYNSRSLILITLFHETFLCEDALFDNTKIPGIFINSGK